MTGLGSEPAISQSDKRAIQTLLWALKPLLNLRGSYPSSLCDHFLIVALDEGKSVSTYARVTGVMATSRNDKSCHSDHRLSEI